MLQRILKAYKKAEKKENNDGSSVILVIITVAFLGMLVAITTYMSYYNYMIKYGDRSSKNNFYTAETALNEIKLGLEMELSDAMAESYTYASRISDKSVSEKENLFKSKLADLLILKLQLSPTDSSHYDVTKLEAYLDKTKWDGNVGAVILTTSADALLESDEGKFTLKNIYVKYTDERGFVSMIKTDIALGFPRIALAPSKTAPDIENYIIVANERLQTEPSTQVTIAGNIYGGSDGIFSSNHSQLNFQEGIYKIIAKKITAEGGYSNADTAVNGVANPKLPAIITREGNQIWTEQVVVDSSIASLTADMYVADDLTVEGRNSKVTLKGNYYGYGNRYAEADGSSSILINGAKTTMDMSGLESLMLMGHAYVGATHYNANTTDASDYVENADDITPNPATDVTPQNQEDLMLGQSIAVKSDQLMYMVPTECMGYEGNVQVLAKNPLTLSEYNILTKTNLLDASNNIVYDPVTHLPKLKYSVVRLDKVMSKIGKSASSYGVTYQPVFRKVDGSILVYYYMSFASEDMANKFFRDYYAADKTAMDAYIQEYISDFKWNESLPGGLTLAGNLIYFDNYGKPTLRNDTSDNITSNIDSITAKIDEYADIYTALSTKLLLDKTAISAEEFHRSVYENIVVEDSLFDTIVPVGTQEWFDNPYAGDSGIKALVVNNPDTKFIINDSNVKDLYLVIASGDVEVQTNFNGLIIAKGTVEIHPSCNYIHADPVNVKKAMNCMESTNTYYAADLLVDKDAYLYYKSTVSDNEAKVTDEKGYIDYSKLVKYENWSKE